MTTSDIFIHTGWPQISGRKGQKQIRPKKSEVGFLIVSEIVPRSCSGPDPRVNAYCTHFLEVFGLKNQIPTVKMTYILGSNTLKFDFKDRAYIENSD